MWNTVEMCGNILQLYCGNYIYLCGMAKSIENKIRFNAVLTYLLIAIAVIVMIAYIYDMRTSIKSRKSEIQEQNITLALTNELIYAVSRAQSHANLYVFSKNNKSTIEFKHITATVDSLIDSLKVLKPLEAEKLQKISTLLEMQVENIVALNREIDQQNPVYKIRDILQEYHPPQHIDTTYVFKERKDTVISKPAKKKFFKRLGEVFKPSKDSTVIVVKKQIDTLTVFGSNDSIPIITEVGKATRKASKAYESKIRTIEGQVSKYIASDQAISKQITTLLLELHKQTLDSTLSAIVNSEQIVKRNFTYSIIAGVCALILILVFIILIIADVNKGKSARERIREVMESRHKLLLSVSHDIKSPLSSILGYLELWKNKEGKAKEVQSMQNSGRHILSLLENLLEFSSLEQGSMQATHTNFNLHDLCSEIYEMFLPQAEKKKLKLTFTADRIRINSDLMKIKQIIINLISNAIKYTDSGIIELSCIYDNGNIVISVNDTGVGIPYDKLEEIYKPFIRVEDNNAMAHGSGLGMYVVKGLINMLNGEININSKVGTGTQIEVLIPSEKVKQPIGKGCKRIAIYDDDPSVMALARDMLLRLGHKIVDTDYDIALTDLDMGSISGVDILKSSGNSNVIVMTGRVDFTLDMALQMGFDGFLAKPFSLDSLREIFGEGELNTDTFLCEENSEEIMAIFRTSTIENIEILRQAIDENNFAKAQMTCHKMLTMYTLLGYPTEILRKMDTQRGKEYEGWQKDIEQLINTTKLL